MSNARAKEGTLDWKNIREDLMLFIYAKQNFATTPYL
jgi:hypothetical protein